MYKKSLYFLLIISFFSCKKNNIIYDTKSLDSTVSQYIDNGSQALLLLRLEDRNGNKIYQFSDKNDKLVPDQIINENTWFRIWSMSKIVTISITMDLVEDGILKLDEPVSKYIPEFDNLKVAVTNDGKSLIDYFSSEDKNNLNNPCPLNIIERKSEMTILQLINHEAGFYYGTTGINCIDDALVSIDLADSEDTDEFVKRLSKLPLIDQPGYKEFYGLNTTVLGIVNERATGQSLSKLVESRITKPMKIVGLKYNKAKNDELLPVFSGADDKIRLANEGELDIMGKYVPGYESENKLFLGGEGMIATADGYADFIRMLLNHGELNGYRFLNESTVKEMYSPHTQLENEYGYNGYNLWVTGKLVRELGQGDEGLWRGGGYEGTHFWIDPKRDFVGVLMSQMFEAPKSGEGRDGNIVGEVYSQIFKNE
jgi:CubicO group peptidase (beta-lactamase class C family)